MQTVCANRAEGDEMDLQKSIFVELNQDNPKTIYSLKAVPEFTIPVVDEPDVAFICRN